MLCRAIHQYLKKNSLENSSIDVRKWNWKHAVQFVCYFFSATHALQEIHPEPVYSTIFKLITSKSKSFEYIFFQPHIHNI